MKLKDCKTSEELNKRIKARQRILDNRWRMGHPSSDTSESTIMKQIECMTDEERKKSIKENVGLYKWFK